MIKSPIVFKTASKMSMCVYNVLIAVRVLKTNRRRNVNI